MLIVSIAFAGAASAWGDHVITTAQNLSDAFNGSTLGNATCEGNTVTLQKDILGFGGGQLVFYNTDPNSPIILDLNGHNITSDGGFHRFAQISDDFSDPSNFTIKDSKGGGTISGFQPERSCGCICVINGRFTMTGGTITNCTAPCDCGGVYVFGDGTFIMSGNATISYCNTTENGPGGVYNKGTFIMTDNAQISHCKGTKVGNGVYNTGDFIIGGSAIIDSDVALVSEDDGKVLFTAKADAQNDNERTFYPITLKTPFTGRVSSISLWDYDDDVENPSDWVGEIVVKNGANFKDKIKLSDDLMYLGYGLVEDGNNLTLKKLPYVEVSSWAELNQSVAEWNATGDEAGLTRTVVVKDDIDDRNTGENTAGINVTGNVIVTTTNSASSSEFKIDGKQQGRFFNVTGGNLTLVGNGSRVLNLTGGLLSEDDEQGGGIFIDAGVVTLNNGAKITNCTINSEKEGGGVYINDGVLNLNAGSSIEHCSADDAGGVYVGNNGRLTMSQGATIAYCTSHSRCGGVWNSGIFAMNGGTITHCEANRKDGGGVYIQGEFNMAGDATISYCNATKNGGGVYISSNGNFTMNGGKITDCSAKESGGGVYIGKGSFTMNDGTITNCTSPGNEGKKGSGGGVYANYEAIGFTMNGGKITGCSAHSSGGGVVTVSTQSQFLVRGNATIVTNTLTSGTINNVHLTKDKFLNLTGPFTGRIGISNLKPGAEPVKFGSTGSGASGAENFVYDDTSSGLYVGTINTSDNNLYWAEGRMVVFDPNNGEDEWDQPVVNNTKVAQPEDPTKKGYTFTGWYNDDAKWDFTTNVTENLTLTANWKENSQPYTPTPVPHKESGQTVIQQQVPVQDVSKDPTPANQATADISASYKSQSVLGTSASDTAALKEQYPEAAAQVELSFALAMEAGVPLTNSKGAKAVVVTAENIPNVEKVTFSRVYEISPANAGEKLTKVTVKVPKSDITSNGLTSDDVTVYHFLDTYNIWVPLETISMTQDDSNYYYTAATDGTSPFGVLVKKIGSDTAKPTTQPTQTQKSPAPFVGILAGLGAAALFLRLRK